MVKLTDYEKHLLDGKEGRLKQVALENIVRYAEVLGANELCEVTKATVFCGKHNYLDVCKSNNFHEVFTKLNLGKDEIIEFNSTSENCYIQSCVAPCDQYEYKSFNQSKEFFDENSYYLEEANKAGVTITGTCSPYLTGWIPIKGEHFVTTESGMTIIGNSLWGACCNADGIEAAFWSAICGRTPKWGYHLEENRIGTHLFKIEADIDSITDWELLGNAIGKKLPPNSNPVIVGNFKNMNFNKIRYFLTALSISSNCRLCHIVGYTPEARTVEDAFKGRKPKAEYQITIDDLRKSYNSFCDKGAGENISLVSLGCPHYDIDQIKKVANYLKGKKIHSGVNFMIWTVYPIKHMADINGYTRIIEDAGGKIYTSTCPVTVGEEFLKNYPIQVYDSLKQSGSARETTENKIYYTDTYKCIDAALTGRWEERFKWKK